MKDAPLKTKQASVSLPMIQDYVNRVLAGETNMPPKFNNGLEIQRQ